MLAGQFEEPGPNRSPISSPRRRPRPASSPTASGNRGVLVTAEIFAQDAGIQLRKVPCKGSVEAVTDVIAGRLDLIFIDINGIRSFVDAGEARFLAATATAKRVSLLPDVPTMVESGYPKVVTGSVSAFFAPAKTPPEILDRYNAEFIRIINSVKPVRDKFTSMGLDPLAMKRGELDDFVKSNSMRWGSHGEGRGAGERVTSATLFQCVTIGVTYAAAKNKAFDVRPTCRGR